METLEYTLDFLKYLLLAAVFLGLILYRISR